MKSRSEKRQYTSARERAEKKATGQGAPYLQLPKNVQLFKPKSGRMLLDMLPYVAGKGNPFADPGNLHWERTFYVHRGIGANNDSFLCPRMTGKERCPICELRAKLTKKGDEDDEELIKELAPKQRQLFNVINLKDPDKGVQLWDISYHLFGKLLDGRIRESEEDEGWDQFFFLEKGLTLKISFNERSFGGFEFMEAESIDFRPRSEDYDEDILEKVHDLDDLLVHTDYDDLKKALLETGDSDKDDDDDEKSSKSKKDDDDDDQDADDEPKKKKKAPSGKDADWDDFDEDDEKPKKKKSSDGDDDDEPKGKSRKSADDDWDDEPKSKQGKDDDDDEPAPKKKNRFKDDDDDDDEKPRVKSGADDDDDDDELKSKSKKKSRKDEDENDD